MKFKLTIDDVDLLLIKVTYEYNYFLVMFSSSVFLPNFILQIGKQLKSLKSKY